MTATFSFPPDTKARTDMLTQVLSKQGVRNLANNDSDLLTDRRDGESGSITETDSVRTSRSIS